MNEERDYDAEIRDYDAEIKEALDKEDYKLAARVKHWKDMALSKIDCVNGKALVSAAMNGDLEKVKSLLKKGAPVNYRNSSHYTALSKASYEGHLEIVKLLVEKGGDVKYETDCGTSVLTMAVYNCHWHIVKFLIGEGSLFVEYDLDTLKKYYKSLKRFPIEEVESLLELMENKEGENG